MYHHDAQSAAAAAGHGETNCTLDSAGLGGHPSPLGSFVIAAVMASVLHGESPVGVTYAPAGISPEDRDWALGIAARAVFGA